MQPDTDNSDMTDEERLRALAGHLSRAKTLANDLDVLLVAGRVRGDPLVAVNKVDPDLLEDVAENFEDREFSRVGYIDGIRFSYRTDQDEDEDGGD